MKVTVQNLGILKNATFELGDLTLICGLNNTGKTYATYALYGFLENWRRLLVANVSSQEISEIFDNGVVRINIVRHAKNAQNILSKGCQQYSQRLSRIFASDSKYFSESKFHLELEQSLELILSTTIDKKLRSKKSEILSFSKPNGNETLTISLSSENANIDLPRRMIKDAIRDVINEILFEQYLPNAFIASAERTGVAIFSKELDFARNRLLEEMAQTSSSIDPLELLFKSYNDYAWPVRANVDFTRRVTDVAKQDSFIAENHPMILNKFRDILGGEYIIGNNNSVYFKPTKKRLKLTMGQSSSAVRSLLDIGTYLRHMAQPGDLLIVDEPELNLHPENQIRIIRLFARLTKIGIRVFITTHSDYIIKELNTLIMLNQDKAYLREISDREGYENEELMDPDKIKVYIAEKSLIKAHSSNKKRSNHPTLVEAHICRDRGIDARSFDVTINKMNEIQEDIVWGI